ncbi:MAG: hypothetical protein K8W52_32515 [Deltaproteobacteria bacterium]|nr:hypothetical protein [Deltaproteobacteria bacterium]
MSFRAEAVAVSVLDRRESELIERALAAVASRNAADAEVLRGLIDQLRETSALLDRTRPLRKPTALGGEPRDESTLIGHLCRLDGLSGDLAIPLKATLSRTYLLTKIMFLRGFVKATTALEQTGGGDFRCLSHDLREELAQSIYTLLAEELFLALLRKPDVPARTKRRAADQLITVWDDAALEIDDFAPLLESAWHARNRITSDFGTLLGASETFRLVREDCDPKVLDFFCRDSMDQSEADAFEEFLFNMTHEELGTLRAAMRERNVVTAKPAWAEEILGRTIDTLEHAREIDPMALYRSYQRRQLAADFRLMAGAHGPKRTAEGYLMVYLLDQQD